MRRSQPDSAECAGAEEAEEAAAGVAVEEAAVVAVAAAGVAVAAAGAVAVEEAVAVADEDEVAKRRSSHHPVPPRFQLMHTLGSIPFAPGRACARSALVALLSRLLGGGSAAAACR